MYNHEKVTQANIACALHPTAGDYWQEMFIPCFLVVAVNAINITYLDQDHVKGTDEHHWTWDTSIAPHTTSIEQFQRRINYGNIRGTWCDVVVGNPRMRVFVDEVLSRFDINGLPTQESATPALAAELVPLTDAQRELLYESLDINAISRSAFHVIVQAVEQAHNIKVDYS